MNWSVNTLSTNVFRKASLEHLFPLSAEGQHRIARGMTAVLNSVLSPDEITYLLDRGMDKDVKPQFEASAFPQIVLVCCSVLLGYVLLGILGHLMIFTRRVEIGASDKERIRYVVFNSSGSIDRLSKLLKMMLGEEDVATFYVFNNQIMKVFRHYLSVRKTAPLTGFLGPTLPGIKTFRSFLAYFIVYGHKVAAELARVSPPGRSRAITASVHRFLCTTIVHYHWAVEVHEMVKKKFPNAVHVFDQGGDLGGKEAVLIDRSNQKGIVTVTVQHGTAIDVEDFLPLSKYMLCCSEREKKEMIAEGVDEKRLFAVGAPLQVVQDFVIDPSTLAPPCRILVLGSNGTAWEQSTHIEFLQASKTLNELSDKCLRLHPGLGKESKELWVKLLPGFTVRERFSLRQEVMSAEVVISFSEDALITVVFSMRKAIFVIVPSKKKELFNRYLTKSNSFLLVSTLSQLERALRLYLQISAQKIPQSIRERELEHEFGAIEFQKVRMNFQKAFFQIRNHAAGS